MRARGTFDYDIRPGVGKVDEGYSSIGGKRVVRHKPDPFRDPPDESSSAAHLYNWRESIEDVYADHYRQTHGTGFTGSVNYSYNVLTSVPTNASWGLHHMYHYDRLDREFERTNGLDSGTIAALRDKRWELANEPVTNYGYAKVVAGVGLVAGTRALALAVDVASLGTAAPVAEAVAGGAMMYGTGLVGQGLADIGAPPAVKDIISALLVAHRGSTNKNVNYNSVIKDTEPIYVD